MVQKANTAVNLAQPTADIEHLTSWKEIAEYLRMSVRTAQRYEREFGLPVRRPTGKERGAVMATRIELNAWITAIPLHKTFKLSRTAANNVMQAAATRMEQNIVAMGRLRDQLKKLRRENRAAMDLLLKEVSALHNLMPPSRPPGYGPLVGLDWPLLMEMERENKGSQSLKTRRPVSSQQNKQPH